jgi:hypothetical protein
MAQREIRRWIASAPAHVFAAVCAQTLSFCQPGASCALQPACGAEPRVGAIATWRSRRGACRLCVTSVEPGRLLALDVSDSGHIVHVRFMIEPWCNGALASCISECDGPFPATARSAITPVFRAFGQVLSEVKSSLERRTQEVFS